MVSPTHVLGHPVGLPSDKAEHRSNLRDAAEKLEATFLFEMLKSAGAGQTRESFGGGAGEDQFASLLLQRQADMIASKGGLGLADKIYEALLEQDT